MELYDVVTKLVGPTRPLGETHEDDRRFDNLAALTELVEKLLADIIDIEATNAQRTEFSMKRAGEFCGRFIRRIGVH